jgi:hypothetical protein
MLAKTTFAKKKGLHLAAQPLVQPSGLQLQASAN